MQTPGIKNKLIPPIPEKSEKEKRDELLKAKMAQKKR